MKKIPIRTDRDKFFRQFLELLRSLPPINKLRPKELDVLAEVMFQNDRYGDLDENIKWTMVFSTSVRKEMRLKVGISEDSFNNNLSILRKHNILSKDNRLMPLLATVFYKNGFKLEYEFKGV